MYKKGNNVRIKFDKVKIVDFDGTHFKMVNLLENYAGKNPFYWPVMAEPFSITEKSFPQNYYLDTRVKLTEENVPYHTRETIHSDWKPSGSVFELKSNYFVVRPTKAFPEDGSYFKYPAEKGKSIKDQIDRATANVNYCRETQPMVHYQNTCLNYVSSIIRGGELKGVVVRIVVKRDLTTILHQINFQEVIEYERAGYEIKLMLFSGTFLHSLDLNLFKML